MKQLTKKQLNSKLLRTSTQGHLQECSEPVRQRSGAVQCQVPGNQASSTSFNELLPSPRLPSARLTWCTLGKPCLLDDSQLGL